VAVTKADLLARSAWSNREMSIKAAIAATGLSGATHRLLFVGHGEGLDVLDRQLDDLLLRAPAQPRLPGFFLPVDRVFSSAGMGTVVTGTLLGAGLERHSHAVVAPMGRSVIVRGLQTHGLDREYVEVGSRTAVNLRNVSRGDVRPGDVLCAPGCFSSAAQIDVRLAVSSTASRVLKHLDEVRVLHGSRSATATVRLTRGNRIEPGESDYAQLRFAAPAIAFAGQRAILRRLSPVDDRRGRRHRSRSVAGSQERSPSHYDPCCGVGRRSRTRSLLRPGTPEWRWYPPGRSSRDLARNLPDTAACRLLGRRVS